jgi:hypothetical protein
MATNNCPPYTPPIAIVGAYREDSETFAVSPINSLINFEYDSFTVDRTTDTLRDIYSYFFKGTPVGIIELTYADLAKEVLIQGKRL